MVLLHVWSLSEFWSLYNKLADNKEDVILSEVCDKQNKYFKFTVEF
jgi:hypothetical protein